MTGSPPASRDVVRSVFCIAAALTLASVVLREIHGARLSYDALAFVWFASWVAGAVSVLASLADIARPGRQRSLYFAVAVIAAQLLGFQEEMDDGVAFGLAVLLWLLLAGVIVMEVRGVLGPSSPSVNVDLDEDL